MTAMEGGGRKRMTHSEVKRAVIHGTVEKKLERYETNTSELFLHQGDVESIEIHKRNEKNSSVTSKTEH